MFSYTLDYRMKNNSSVHQCYDSQEEARKEAQGMFVFHTLNGLAVESITLKMFRSHVEDGTHGHGHMHTDQINVEDLLAEFVADNVLAEKCVPHIGMGATEICYSDKRAYTIIAKTKCTITVQRDHVERKESFKPEFVPGGFSVICTNQNVQEWNTQPSPDGIKVTLHRNKGKGWCHNGTTFVMGKREEFYDYNF